MKVAKYHLTFSCYENNTELTLVLQKFHLLELPLLLSKCHVFPVYHCYCYFEELKDIFSIN